MPRGKKQLNRPSAGGIKRNDYHRPNRKENKSMHKHSFGRQMPADQGWMPRLQLDALIREAVAQSARKVGLPERLVGVKKACVDYLRHCHTDYGQQLRAQRASTFRLSPAEYLTISESVFQEIAEAYPWLADECGHQLEHRRRMTMRTKLIRKAELESQRVRWFNERHGVSVQSVSESNEELTDDEYSAAMASSLKFEATIYSPPFLKPDEIKARRFSDQYGEMNDRWWEWDSEKKAKREQERFKWVA